jgi:hypothetical protein
MKLMVSFWHIRWCSNVYRGVKLQGVVGVGVGVWIGIRVGCSASRHRNSRFNTLAFPLEVLCGHGSLSSIATVGYRGLGFDIIDRAVRGRKGYWRHVGGHIAGSICSLGAFRGLRRSTSNTHGFIVRFLYGFLFIWGGSSAAW